MTIGSLDRPQDIPPARHYGVESRVGWLDGIDQLPVETTGAAMPAERSRRYINYQHPDHDTPDDPSETALFVGGKV